MVVAHLVVVADLVVVVVVVVDAYMMFFLNLILVTIHMMSLKDYDDSCNHIIIQSFHHHEDASLALWALFLKVFEFSRPN